MTVPDDVIPHELVDALAVLDARRRLQAGIRRCDDRAQALARSGAVSGGDQEIDRRLDRALRDRHLLREMKAEVRTASKRLPARCQASRIDDLVSAVPLAPLQRAVFCDRLGGHSWPRIAAARTRGDRGTAVRAYRQAVGRVTATVAVIGAQRQLPGSPAGEIASLAGVSLRTVNMILRHLRAAGDSEGRVAATTLPPADDARAQARQVTIRVPVHRHRGHGRALSGAARAGAGLSGGGTGATAADDVCEQPDCYSGAPRDPLAIMTNAANGPNPGGWAEPCDRDCTGSARATVAWRILGVRPLAELSVKVALEQALGDRVRCRIPRLGGGLAGGYLAVWCTDMEALHKLLPDVRGVRGWVGRPSAAEPAGGATGAVVDPYEHAATWCDPRGVLS